MNWASLGTPSTSMFIYSLAHTTRRRMAHTQRPTTLADIHTHTYVHSHAHTVLSHAHDQAHFRLWRCWLSTSRAASSDAPMPHHFLPLGRAGTAPRGGAQGEDIESPPPSSSVLQLGGPDPPPSSSVLQLGGLDPPPSSSVLQLGGRDPPPSC